MPTLLVDYQTDVLRPKTRGDCVGQPRPCPFVSCRHHLYLEVSGRGGIRINFPDTEVEDMEHSCSLDEAETGPMTLSEVSKRTGVTKERVRQVEELALYFLEPLARKL
jgi:hypothetical protein